MAPANHAQGKPPVVIGRTDFGRLWTLAVSLHVQEGDVADQLMGELDRAKIIPDDQVGSDVVAMGTTVRFTTDTGDDRTVTLVFPNEADIAQDRVSVFTPIGAALIGLSPGQSMDWPARNGSVRRLTVQAVNGG